MSAISLQSWRGALLLFGAVLVLALLTVFGTLQIQGVATRWVTHTHQVLEAIDGTLSSLKDAETGQRGYLLTNDPNFLAPYRQGVAALPGMLDTLSRLTADNELQQRTLAGVRSEVKAKLAVLAEAITLKDEGRSEAVLAMIRAGGGTAAMNELEIYLGAMRAEENRLLALRSARVAKAHAWTFVAVTAMGALAVLLLVILRTLMARDGARIRKSEERLATTLASVGDAVIATDSQGQVERMNPVAEHLTGWTTAAAEGHPLDTVFRIINEHTREPVESPHHKVLREGKVVGLANHTLLIAKDGTERPIEDSGAPIHSGDGTVAGVVLVFKDASERYQAERQLRESDARFRALADHIPQLAWIADAGTEGQIYWFNRNWFDYTGATLEQMMGSGWHTVLHPDQAARVIEKFSHHVKEGLDWEDIFALRAKNGEYRWFLSRMKCIRDDSGTVVRIFGTNTDISEQRRMEDELRRLAEELSEADRRKDEFIATLAHELRNPLAPIRTAVRLLKPDAPNATMEKARDIIERQANQMARLLDDLLDVSRITRGLVELHLEVFDLRHLVEEAIVANRALIERLHHELTVNLAGDALNVEADPIRLRQVIENLLQNAAKYTDPGGRIEVSATGVDERVILTIIDSGIGIDPSSLSRVFDLFTQLHTPERGRGGLGIGLAVVKRIVQLHRGEVQAFSEGFGRGTTITVSLPRTAAQRLEQAKPIERVATLFRNTPRVLVVDDQPDVLESMALLLRESSYSVHTAEDGVLGLQVAESLVPDVMILDIGMPNMDGYQLARWVRQQSWGHQTKLIAVTGWGQEADRRRTLDAGFDAHLVKPVDPDALIRLIDELSAQGSGEATGNAV